MIAISVFLVVLIYLGVAIWASVAMFRSTRASGMGRVAQWVSGGLVALVFYLIPFWDWIPTVIAHRYYCANEAKFIVHKTIDQWKSENKGVLGDLRYYRDAKIEAVGTYRRFPLNQRLASERTDPTPVILSIRRTEGRIIDTKNGEVLVQYADFIAGHGSFGVGGDGAWKVWLDLGRCKGESRGMSGFVSIEQAIQKLGSDK